MVQIIRTSNLDRTSQDDLLTRLSSFHVEVGKVARRQGKRNNSARNAGIVRVGSVLATVGVMVGAAALVSTMAGRSR